MELLIVEEETVQIAAEEAEGINKVILFVIIGVGGLIILCTLIHCCNKPNKMKANLDQTQEVSVLSAGEVDYGPKADN